MERAEPPAKKKPVAAQIAISVLAAILLVLHLVFPKAGIDTTTLGLLAILIAAWLVPYARSIKLPGGTEIDLREKLRGAEESLAKVNVPPSAQLLGRGAQETEQANAGSELEAQLLSEDPNLALAGLRIKIEQKLREIAERTGFFIPGRASAGQMIAVLRSRGRFDAHLASALSDVISICNRALHGASVDSDLARRTLAVGRIMISTLEDMIRLDELGRQQARRD